ncbi:DUF3606 domain-containing protein [Variovorax sp. J22P240]
MRSWSRRLGRTPARLRKDVRKVGHSADAVREYLTSRR